MITFTLENLGRMTRNQIMHWALKYGHPYPYSCTDAELRLWLYNYTNQKET